MSLHHTLAAWPPEAVQGDVKGKAGGCGGGGLLRTASPTKRMQSCSRSDAARERAVACWSTTGGSMSIMRSPTPSNQRTSALSAGGSGSTALRSQRGRSLRRFAWRSARAARRSSRLDIPTCLGQGLVRALVKRTSRSRALGFDALLSESIYVRILYMK